MRGVAAPCNTLCCFQDEWPLDPFRRTFLTRGVADLLMEGCRSLMKGFAIKNEPAEPPDSDDPA